jgi:hypothetical protein
MANAAFMRMAFCARIAMNAGRTGLSLFRIKAGGYVNCAAQEEWRLLGDLDAIGIGPHPDLTGWRVKSRSEFRK